MIYRSNRMYLFLLNFFSFVTLIEEGACEFSSATNVFDYKAGLCMYIVKRLFGGVDEVFRSAI